MKINIFNIFLFILLILNCNYEYPYDPKVEIKPVTNLIANQDGEWIRLGWDHSKDIRSRIEIERKSANNDYAKIATLNDVKTTTFLDTTITTDIEYIYRICGYSDQNKSDFTQKLKQRLCFPSHIH